MTRPSTPTRPFPSASAVALAVTSILGGCGDRTAPAEPGDDGVPVADFLDVAGIVDELSRLEASSPEIGLAVDLTERYGAPPTHQGRHLWALKISDRPAVEEDEPAFLLVAAHHGNEIGTPVVALEAAARLVDGYGRDPAVRALVDEHEIWIAPLWNPDGYPGSRKNGRPGGGVDLNRNYPFLWDSECSGSADPTASSYRGPDPASEPETITMMRFSEEQRFTKVLDVHSAGRETVYAYRCTAHPLRDYLEIEAAEISRASGYDGRRRAPSGEGEHYQWQLGTYGNFAFLVEIGATQSPSYAAAVAEADRVWPATLWMLDRPVPVQGHVRDAVSGAPVAATVEYDVGEGAVRREENRSEPLHGRFHAFLPPGPHRLRFSRTGYVAREVSVDVTAAGSRVEVALEPVGPTASRPDARATTSPGPGGTP